MLPFSSNSWPRVVLGVPWLAVEGELEVLADPHRVQAHHGVVEVGEVTDLALVVDHHARTVGAGVPTDEVVAHAGDLAVVGGELLGLAKLGADRVHDADAAVGVEGDRVGDGREDRVVDGMQLVTPQLAVLLGGDEGQRVGGDLAAIDALPTQELVAGVGVGRGTLGDVEVGAHGVDHRRRHATRGLDELAGLRVDDDRLVADHDLDLEPLGVEVGTRGQGLGGVLAVGLGDDAERNVVIDLGQALLDGGVGAGVPAGKGVAGTRRVGDVHEVLAIPGHARQVRYGAAALAVVVQRVRELGPDGPDVHATGAADDGDLVTGLQGGVAVLLHGPALEDVTIAEDRVGRGQHDGVAHVERLVGHLGLMTRGDGALVGLEAHDGLGRGPLGHEGGAEGDLGGLLGAVVDQAVDGDGRVGVVLPPEAVAIHPGPAEEDPAHLALGLADVDVVGRRGVEEVGALARAGAAGVGEQRHVGVDGETGEEGLVLGLDVAAMATRVVAHREGVLVEVRGEDRAAGDGDLGDVLGDADLGARDLVVGDVGPVGQLVGALGIRVLGPGRVGRREAVDGHHDRVGVMQRHVGRRRCRRPRSSPRTR